MIDASSGAERPRRNGARGPAAVTREERCTRIPRGTTRSVGLPEEELVTIAAMEGDTATIPLSFRVGAGAHRAAGPHDPFRRCGPAGAHRPVIRRSD